MFLKALDILGAVVVTSVSALTIIVTVAFLYYIYRNLKED